MSDSDDYSEEYSEEYSDDYDDDDDDDIYSSGDDYDDDDDIYSSGTCNDETFVAVDLGEWRLRAGEVQDEGEYDCCFCKPSAGYSRGRITDADQLQSRLSDGLKACFEGRPLEDEVNAVVLAHGLPGASALEPLYEMLFESMGQDRVILGSQGSFAGVAAGKRNFAAIGVGQGLIQLSCFCDGYNMQNCAKGSARYLEFGARDLPVGRGVDADGLVLPDGAAVLAHTAMDVLAQGVALAERKQLVAKQLLGAVVVYGGPTYAQGFVAQTITALKHQYSRLTVGKARAWDRTNECDVTVIAESEMDSYIAGPDSSMPSVGASIVGCMGSTEWTTRAEFNEHGLTRCGRVSSAFDWYLSSPDESKVHRLHDDHDMTLDDSFPSSEYWANLQMFEDT